MRTFPRNKFKAFVSLLIFLFFNSLIAQINHYSLEDGLSQANVRCIQQDKSGFLWFGTQDGLNRFDGKKFTKFKKDVSDSNSIPANYISCISEDIYGNLLIGTINGAVIYNPITNKINRIKIRINDNYVNVGSVSSFIQSKDSSLWIGTYFTGVYKILKDSVIHFSTKSPSNFAINSDFIMALSEDSFGNIWIGTFGNGLNKYDITKKKIEKIDAAGIEKLPNMINAIIRYDQNFLLICTTNGLALLDLKSNKLSVHKIAGKFNNVMTALTDKEKNIWVSFEGEGIYKFDLSSKTFIKTVITLDSKSNIEEKNIWAIYNDDYGNLWFGTTTNGVIKLKRKREIFQNYSEESSGKLLTNYSVRAVFVDNDYNTWIGTDNGLFKIIPQTKKIEKYFYNDRNSSSINDNKILCIAADRKGNVWIGTQRGLAMYNKQSNNFKRFIHRINTKEQNPSFPVRTLYFDKNNLLWFGTFGAGLFSLNVDENMFVSHSFNTNNPDSKKDVVIFQIKEGNNNELWLATATGFILYNKKTKSYKRYFSDSKDDFTKIQCVVYSIEIENDSTFWIGTLSDGLIKFNPVDKKFSFLTEKDGLPNNTVYGIIRDKQNNLWLSTNRGLSKYDTRNYKFINYDKNDGVSSEEFNTGAFTKSIDGKIYFGGINGLVFFNPANIYHSTKQPQIVISEFKVFDKQINPGKIFLDGERIILNYEQNYFSFEFTSLDYTSPSKNEFSYYLDGYDNNWIYAGGRNYTTYTNVEPGKYIFKVKGSNSDGVWNEAGIKIDFIITPPFWATTWFRLFLIILSISILIFFYKIRTNKLKREKQLQHNYASQLIESQENERKRIASELHDSIGQNLVIIKNRAILAIKNPKGVKEQLEEILNISSQTIYDVRTIAYNLRPYQLGKIGLTTAINAVIKQSKESSPINFVYEIDNIDNAFDEENEIHLYRIIQECLSNALKHSAAKSISLKIKKDPFNLLISYNDDGKGFNFETEKSSPSGLGISSLMQRVGLLNGVMEIESSFGQGTKIIFSFPLKKG